MYQTIYEWRDLEPQNSSIWGLDLQRGITTKVATGQQTPTEVATGQPRYGFMLSVQLKQFIVFISNTNRVLPCAV